jgi:hypothetical protein
MEASKLVAEMKAAVKAMDKKRDMILSHNIDMMKTLGKQSENAQALLTELRDTIDGYDEAVTAMETVIKALGLEYPAK